MISHIQNVFSLCTDELGENVARAFPSSETQYNINNYTIYQLVMRVSKIYLPNILGLLAEVQCACPFSELRFWCPPVAGSCLRWKTTVFWHLPPLCRNTIASLCVVRWATSGEKILLLYYYFRVTLSTDDNGYYEPNNLPKHRVDNRTNTSWSCWWTSNHCWSTETPWHHFAVS